MRYAPGRIAARNSAFTRCLVSALAATLIGDRVGDGAPPRAASGRTRCPARRPPRASGSATRPPPASRTRAPGPRSPGRSAPGPRCRACRPCSPRALEYSPLFHGPGRRSATWSGIRRSQASSSPITSSATAIEFLPGQLADEDPRGSRRWRRRSCRCRRRPGSPARARCPRSSASAPTFLLADDEDVGIGLPDQSRGQLLAPSRRAGRPPSQPSSLSPSMPTFSNLSAIRTFMRSRRASLVDEQPAAQLGLEPGALGRHDLPGVRHRHELLQRGGEQREGDRHLAGVHPPARAPPGPGSRPRSRSACRCAGRRCPRIGPSTRSCSRATSSDADRIVPVDGGRVQLQAIPRGLRDRCRRHPARSGSGLDAGCSRPTPRSRASTASGVSPFEVAHHPVVGQDAELRRRRRARRGTSCTPRRPGVSGVRLPELLARAPRAGGAVVPVGHVGMRDRLERAGQAGRRRRPARPCAAPRRAR